MMANKRNSPLEIHAACIVFATFQLWSLDKVTYESFLAFKNIVATKSLHWTTSRTRVFRPGVINPPMVTQNINQQGATGSKFIHLLKVINHLKPSDGYRYYE